ncbi:MAG: ribonuclease HI family protein [Deltaproteobacteria bacterium]
MNFNHICLYTDGGSKGNPGPGSIALIICNSNNEILQEYSECIGHCTNNQAEYKALIKGLDLSARYTRRKVTCYSDSELLIKQMNGQYRLKNAALRKLFHQVQDLVRMYDEVVYQHVLRGNQRITRADQLVKQAHAGRHIDKVHVIP